ncbi:hypothetical protein MWU78_19090 [Arenibacter sp. F26102]|uniref:hypothetical protein n=1 Tax=Arenibacter sp. F26102 TaxID=2926416 RepID=UPI001FF242B2|nr:hypothetical protein [Arenibacter sp. F26102]MCK0147767.1 hypothetical protein [Arenibacter sp. F26102]
MSIIAILIPTVLFVLQFKSYSISNSIAEWGSFGDYFGGILNPIISFASLVLLGYITVIVAKNSNKENYILNVKLRRMDAYKELTEFSPTLNSLATALSDFFDQTEFILNFHNASLDEIINNNNYDDANKSALKKDLKNRLSEDLSNHLNNELYKMSEATTKIDEFENLITFAHLRFGHLFKYDFKSEEYNKISVSIKIIANKTRKMKGIFNSLKMQFNGKRINDLRKEFQDLIKELKIVSELLVVFYNSISQELEYKDE